MTGYFLQRVLPGIFLLVAPVMSEATGNDWLWPPRNYEGPPAAVQPSSCDAGPSNPATSATSNREENPLIGESTAGGFLRRPGGMCPLSLTGGNAYSNAHFYRTLRAEPDSRRFLLSLRFWFTPTTFNNEGGFRRFRRSSSR